MRYVSRVIRVAWCFLVYLLAVAVVGFFAVVGVACSGC